MRLYDIYNYAAGIIGGNMPLLFKIKSRLFLTFTEK